MNTNCIDITFLSMPQRDLAVLQVYLQGVGSKVFREVAEGKAEVAIFDYDYLASRSHWELFSQTYGRPCIAFSAEELNLPNTTWVSKPVKIAALAEAAAKLRTQLGSNQRVAVSSPTSQTVAEPIYAPIPTASPVIEKASVNPVTPQPTTPVQSETSNSSTTDNLVNVLEDKKKSPVLILAVGGVAIIAGLWFFMRPSADQGQQIAESSSAPIGQTASIGTNSADTLRSAVDTSITQYQTKSASEKSFISAQLDNLNNRSTSVVDDVKSKLDSMMGDQKALAEYNQAVYNKVQIAADAPAEKSEAAATEKDTRSKLESLVGAALTEQAGSSTFVTSIKSESKAHEAEMRTITVIPGDTLSAIAQRAYGDYTLYPKIFEANPRTLTSPNHIFPGQVLRVPL